VNEQQQVAEQAEAEKRAKEKQNLALEIQKALATPEGKKLLKHLSAICHEHEPTYVELNPNGSAYNEGQRSIILNIRAMLSKNVNKVIQKEAKL